MIKYIITGGDIMLSVTEVAEMLNVSRQMIHKLISNGELPYYKIGNLYRFEDEEIKKWLEERKKNECWQSWNYKRPIDYGWCVKAIRICTEKENALPTS